MTDKTYKLSGIKYQHKNLDLIDSIKEEFDRKGFVVIKNIFNSDLVSNLQSAYAESIKKNYQYYSEVNIEMTKREQGIIRQIYRYDEIFLDAITKPEVTGIVDRLLDDDWLITQQNGSHVDYENLSKDSVGVQVWHRDFVFRHVTTSKPILINILVPLDEFTVDSGATNVLPYSHLFENFPSNEFLLKNLAHAEASPGDIIVLNGLTYHSAGQNLAGLNRRSFNTVFAVPLFRHQVDPFPEVRSDHFDKKYGKFLTAGYANNPTILEYLKERNA